MFGLKCDAKTVNEITWALANKIMITCEQHKHPSHKEQQLQMDVYL